VLKGAAAPMAFGQGGQARLLLLLLEGGNDSCEAWLPAPPRPPPVRVWC
jgi:hypothetical protein